MEAVRLDVPVEEKDGDRDKLQLCGVRLSLSDGEGVAVQVVVGLPEKTGVKLALRVVEVVALVDGLCDMLSVRVSDVKEADSVVLWDRD